MLFIGYIIYFAALLFTVFILPMLGASSAVSNITALTLVTYGFIQDYRKRQGPHALRHIPIVPNWPIIGCLPYISVKFVHLSLTTWAKTLGPVFRIGVSGDMIVIASNYETIREVCIVNGKNAGGRPLPFLTEYILGGTGILFSYQPDGIWKSLRMASQKHLKQFGDGLSRLESVILDNAKDMFTAFSAASKSGRSVDPKDATFDAALNTISYLITGVRNKAGDEIVEKMRKYEKTVLSMLGGSSDMEYDQYEERPWLRHLNMSSWQTIQSMKKLQNSIWKDVQEINEANLDAKSLFKVLKSHVSDGRQSDSESDIKFSEQDVQMTILSLLLAGVTTTSTTFYSLINILAHRPHIQDKLFRELKKVGKTNDPITLSNRQDMPYCRAVLFETLRYASVVPLGVPHRTVSEIEIGGFKLPQNTTIMTNLWGLHHDPDFWAEPYRFIPERFLDADGEMVLADHPNRKHLMPFGAGPRVCLGEAMALARIFLWIATFTQRFQVFPADDNTPEKTGARNYEFDGVVRVCPYKVKFVQRQS